MFVGKVSGKAVVETWVAVGATAGAVGEGKLKDALLLTLGRGEAVLCSHFVDLL